MILCTGRIAFLLSVSLAPELGHGLAARNGHPPQPVVPDWIFVSTSYIPPVGKTCFGSVGHSWQAGARGEGPMHTKCRLRNPVAGGALGRNPSARARRRPPMGALPTLRRSTRRCPGGRRGRVRGVS